ncbi:hypothetical protein AQUCO_02700326v1 [Aquilegia coerulea]|uniref:RING-type domain-containing protein n=1 Tax=Aquilegia coerulea TaxID=218851 RepID=A0A2G5D6D3_AQUCA|nr:hypothetical protein AQUCO_02700326v1 [Aquilegia coerulea]
MEGSNGGVSTTTTSSPSTPYSTFNLSQIHYVLIMFAFTLALVTIYHLLFMKCCPQRSNSTLLAEGMIRGRTSLSFPNWHSIPSCVYRKDETTEIQEGCHSECSVCLCGFVDGEEIRQLPLCKHFFHSSCIDMWLYSHSDCPICRATAVISRPTNIELIEERDRRQDLPVSRSLV